MIAQIFPEGHFALLMKIKVMPGGLFEHGIYNMQHNQQTIHRAPETYAQSDSCKKRKNFSRQAYSFLEEKLRHLQRKMYEGKYNMIHVIRIYLYLPVLIIAGHNVTI